MVASSASIKKHLTDLAEWRKLGEAGIFSAESRLELIHGEILEMSPIGSAHAGHLNRINQYFAQRLGAQTIVSIQNPLQLDNFSEPEPDLMLLKPRADFYSDSHPTQADVLLLIEIADTSLNYDRGEKLALYAQHGISEYWVLNLIDQCLEIYRDPKGNQYEQKTTLRQNAQISLLNIPGISINIADIL